MGVFCRFCRHKSLCHNTSRMFCVWKNRWYRRGFYPCKPLCPNMSRISSAVLRFDPGQSEEIDCISLPTPYSTPVPEDLRIVTIGSRVLRGKIWPASSAVSGEGNLVQRVFINLLTDPGDDESDPEWGSGLRQRIRGIAGQDIQRARTAVSAALAKCASDVRDAMSASTDPTERLESLTLNTLEYDQLAAAWRCSVVLDSEATAGITFELPLR